MILNMNICGMDLQTKYEENLRLFNDKPKMRQNKQCISAAFCTGKISHIIPHFANIDIEASKC